MGREWQFLRALVVGVALGGAGCLLEVEHVADPRPAFAKARREAQRYQGRPGPAHEFNLVAYDGDKGQLVRLSLPMWMVRKLEDEEIELDGHDRTERALRQHLRLRDIEQAGLGVLIEVEERESQVLVWLR